MILVMITGTLLITQTIGETEIIEGEGLPLVAQAAENYPSDSGCPKNDLECKPQYIAAVQESKQRKIILISIESQKMTTLHRGAPFMTTAVTTGRNEFNTPPGVYRVKNKLQNVNLKAPKQFQARGINYNLKVKKWLGLGAGYGIHDASWRGSNFGGPDYLSNGSHGCINTPLSAVSKLHTWTPVGTKVIIF